MFQHLAESGVRTLLEQFRCCGFDVPSWSPTRAETDEALREHLSRAAAMADDGDGDVFDDSPDDFADEEADEGGDAATMKCGSCGQVIMGADGKPRAPGSEAHNCKRCSRPLLLLSLHSLSLSHLHFTPWQPHLPQEPDPICL